MAKQRTKKRRNKPQPTAVAAEVNPATGEDRRAEAVTVGWMLTMLATASADVLAVMAAILVPLLLDDKSITNPGLAPLLPKLLLFIAAVTGTVCMLITPLVYRFRREPPPLPITVFGVIVSVLPVVALFAS